MGVRFLREVGRDPLYKIWHSSRDALLLYVHAGQGHAVSREKLCPLRPGTLCFIGGDVEHYTVPHDPSIYDRSKLFVDQATLSTLLSLLPETSPLRALSSHTALCCTALPERDREEVTQLLQKASEAGNEADGGAAVLLSVLLSLLSCLGREQHEPPAPTPTPLTGAIAYIHENVASPLCVEDICRAAHMSKFHFCRIFRERMGVTVMEYVLRTRLLQAKILLRTTSLPIGEISEACGFGSPSYFSRVFREQEGKTPLALRREG